MAIALACSPNAAIAYDFFVRKGLTDVQAAAIVGNLLVEAPPDVNPKAFNSGEAAYGIAQWRFERASNLFAFASGNGRDVWALETQLDFLWNELETSPQFGFAELRAAASLEDAVRAFQNRFERCGACNEPKRIQSAYDVLHFCPLVTPPAVKPKGGVVAATVGVVALVGAVGYGIYKWITAPKPRAPVIPRPRPVPIPPDPDAIYRGEI